MPESEYDTQRVSKGWLVLCSIKATPPIGEEVFDKKAKHGKEVVAKKCLTNLLHRLKQN